MEKATFVTFIIPTLGRPTLKIAVESIINQPDWNWSAIVVWDGISPNYDSGNERVINLVVPKKGHAGLVRNEAFPYVETDWIAFLDDDDWIANTYMQTLKSYTNKDPNLDVIVFTYKDITNNNIQPPPHSIEIKECNVGISFAIRTSFVKNHNLKFTPFSVEDFRFLDDARRNGAKILITNNIQYYVGGRSGWL